MSNRNAAPPRLQAPIVRLAILLLFFVVVGSALVLFSREINPQVLAITAPPPTHAPRPTEANSSPAAQAPIALPSSTNAPIVINIITPVPSSTPLPIRPRIFVASEKTNTVEVFEDEPPRFVTSIPVGIFPHNISVSNDGRYVGVDDRHSDEISIIDTKTLTEVQRIHVGRQPHDLSWSPDDARIYVTQERDNFISIINTQTWKTAPPIRLDTPTHDLTISPDGKEIWATTIRYRGLVIMDTKTLTVTDRLAYFPHGSHDAYFVNNGSEVWVTSSGFIENASQADPNVVIFDAATRKIKTIQPMGEYPFHSVKQFRDGLFLPANSQEIWFSDRGLGGVILVDTNTRQVLASIKTGAAPFHLSFGPNGLLYVVNHDDSTFSVIDPTARQVLHTIPVGSDPHGIVVIGVTGDE
jgi:YVTN family beta-propeller protein